MSFDPNEKQSVICERKLWKIWDQWNEMVWNQLGKLKISCTRSVKERQKLASKLCIGRNKTECVWQAWESETFEQTVQRKEWDRMHKASMRQSETFEKTVQRKEWDRMHKASMRASETPDEVLCRKQSNKEAIASKRKSNVSIERYFVISPWLSRMALICLYLLPSCDVRIRRALFLVT